ncbi:hypothetical protein, partial [uncultured Sutterella sp.]
QAGAPQSSADHLWASSPKRSPSKGTLFRLTIVGRIEVLLVKCVKEKRRPFDRLNVVPVHINLNGRQSA